jgi:hypothetical protein
MRTDPARRRDALAEPSLPAGTRLALARLHSGQSADDPDAHFQLAAAALLVGYPDEAAAALIDCADNTAPFERRDFARRLRHATAGQPQLSAITAELEEVLFATPDSQADSDSRDTVPGTPTDDGMAGLVTAWTSATTWEDSEAFLASHSRELLTLAGYAALGQLAAARPGDDRPTLHVNLFRAVLAQGITAAYAQLRADLDRDRQAALLSEWIGLAADPAGSAAYLADHARDLTDPRAISLLAAECDRDSADPQLWQHLGLLSLADQTADAYSAAQTGTPSPFQRATALLDSSDLDHALAWGYLARAADPGPGALLISQIHTRRNEPDQAKDALATAAGQIDPRRLDEVLDAYDQLITAQPGDSWLHAGHADALQRAGRPSNAITALDRALSLAPDDASLHVNKAYLLFGQTRFDEAQAELLIAGDLAR